MKLINRVKRDCFPTWEITFAEPDFFEPSRRIRVKVKKPLSKDSKMKIKGNAINSELLYMKMPFYWFKGKKMTIREVTKAFCDYLVKIKASVRVPALEERHKDELRTQIKEKYREAKKVR